MLDNILYGVQENVIDYNDSIVHYVNALIQDAIHKSASDIHIEPDENTFRIRFRQNGLLYEISQLPHPLATRLITRLKVMAQLDISERRLPQDGRFQLHANTQHRIDIRMNTCPTLFGEKVVLRLLDMKKNSLAIDTLGLSDSQKTLFLEKISAPQGLILVTGPTGSGKTTTLYAALHHLNIPEKNISTVEDPIEIQLKGINQVNINPKIGLDFSSTLRSFLRQDPDILMIGEIRDPETAITAIQAAQTGHLVFSTVHTNNAFETLLRLQSMGISPYDLTHSVSLIIAQRLIRTLCPLCKLPEEFPSQIFYQANGCHHCLQGYQHRTAIYELLPMTEKIAKALLTGSPIENHEYQTLREAGIEKVKQGITSLSEINRVIREKQ